MREYKKWIISLWKKLILENKEMIKQITKEEFFLGYPPEKVYVTSDLHLFHTNIIQYCNRPFEFSSKGCSEMNEFILKKFDELPEDCLIWNLGDVYLSLRLEESKIMNDVMRMKKNRKMCLILGNHDFRVKKKPFSNYVNFFKHLGFDKVYNAPLQFENFIFSHEPVYIEKGSNLINIHGHTHNVMVPEDYFLGEYNDMYPKAKIEPKNYRNACMDANAFQLLKWNEIGSENE